MITRFNNYILESRKSVEDLEMLNPEELGDLLISQSKMLSPNIEYICDLLDVGCPVDARDRNGDTPLYFAALSGHLDVVKLLISRGANINAKDSTGRTILHWVVSRGDIEITRFLISKGADIHARTNAGRLAWDMTNSIVREAVPELNPNK